MCRLSGWSYDATLVSDAHSREDLTPWGAPPPDKVIDTPTSIGRTTWLLEGRRETPHDRSVECRPDAFVSLRSGHNQATDVAIVE
jgi:hypothetical protein